MEWQKREPSRTCMAHRTWTRPHLSRPRKPQAPSPIHLTLTKSEIQPPYPHEIETQSPCMVTSLNPTHAHVTDDSVCIRQVSLLACKMVLWCWIKAGPLMAKKEAKRKRMEPHESAAESETPHWFPRTVSHQSIQPKPWTSVSCS